MMLNEGQYQIGDVKMGAGTMYRVTAFDPDYYEPTAQDRAVAGTDELRFGRDSLAPGAINIELSILDNYNLGYGPVIGQAIVPGRELLEQLAWEWRADSIRKVYGAQKPLYYRKNGATKVLFGRPRKFNAQKTRLGGEIIPVVMTYQTIDTYAYSDKEYSAGCSLNNSCTATRPNGQGRGPTWCKIILVGPITKPIITTNTGIKLEFNYNIAAGEVVAVDPTPWIRSIISTNGQALTAKLINGSTYLDQIILNPNFSTVFSIAGTGGNSQSAMYLSWRESFVGY